MKENIKIDDLEKMIDAGTLRSVYVPIPQREDGTRVAPTYISFDALDFVNRFSAGYGHRQIPGNINGDMFWVDQDAR